MFLDLPGAASWTINQATGLGIPDKVLLDRVPLQPAVQLVADVAQVADRGCAMRELNVAERTLPGQDAVGQVLDG